MGGGGSRTTGPTGKGVWTGELAARLVPLHPAICPMLGEGVRVGDSERTRRLTSFVYGLQVFHLLRLSAMRTRHDGRMGIESWLDMVNLRYIAFL